MLIPGSGLDITPAVRVKVLWQKGLSQSITSARSVADELFNMDAGRR